MTLRPIGWCAAALLSVATPARAQTAIGTDQATPPPAAIQTSAFKPRRVERFLNALEKRALVTRLFTPADGLGVRIGGITDGSGLAVGPAWRHSYLAGGHVQAHASAALSIRQDREVEAGIVLPHLAADLVRVSVSASATRLAQEDFYGLGRESIQANWTTFGLDRRAIESAITVAPVRWLEVAGGLATLRTTVADVVDPQVFAPATTYRRTHAAATIDYRDRPRNPRSGGRYHVALQRFAAADDARASFKRLDAELEQHLSAWKKQRLLTLSAVVSLSEADAGHDMPFYMQRTLGGSRLLRGFVHDRFRDRNLVVLQGEYGWDVTPFINAVLFYEAGTVAAQVRDLSLARVRDDYGLGFRLGSTGAVAFRTDLAFGGDSTRFIMRLSHAF
ncbi:MAG TPA: BamA/TamA family outer membrane protein [Vicinamibacterales bacterium]|nr:BamA/TamA family outer membrane protein [Vicinamibacterales bacterium]